MHKGRLFERFDGRYALPDGYYWTCGDYMEIWDSEDQVWIGGRVEYGRCYYFTDGDGIEIPLYDGMLVRC